jgi:dTDP-4-dehydrorhamnose 3,5-epimerase-like enzyme
MAKNSVKQIILPLIKDDSNLIFGQEKTHFPFPIKRIFYISKPKPGLPRGFHAHKNTKQILFCIQGSIKLIVDDRKSRKAIILNKPNIGILLEDKIWYEMHNFKKETIILVLASDVYKEDDYIRDYNEFRKYRNDKKEK